MTDKYIHMLISSSNWSTQGILYRRNRLVKYLLSRKDTDSVIWVHPISASLRKPATLSAAQARLKNNPLKNEFGFIEWALPDFLPGRIMMYKTGFYSLHFRRLKKYIDLYKKKKILWYAYPAYPYITDLTDWDAVVYDCSDLWIEPSNGIKSKAFSSLISTYLISNAEKVIAKNSSVIFASSEYLKVRINNITGREVVLIENGVDSFHLQNNKNIDASIDFIPRPRLGYVGAMRGKIDFELLNKISDEKSEWSIVLIGPNCLKTNELFEKLIKKNNVFWIDKIQSENVPLFISELDVGLLPYREIAYNKGVFPLKFYEYLAQGVPVVGCGLPATKKYAEVGLYVHVSSDRYIEACTYALQWDRDIGNNNLYNKRIKMAQEAVWENKFIRMWEQVKEKL